MRRAKTGRAAVVGAAVAALLVVGGIVAVSRGDEPGRLPPGGPPSQLARMQAKGALATDPAWLEGFAAHVADLDLVSAGDVALELTSPADVRVAFAGDVAGRRVVGYGGLFSTGGVDAYTWLTRWSVGPVGAAPEQMRDAGPDTSGTQETMSLVLPPEGAERPAAAVVVSSQEPLVELVGPPRYAADGAISAPRVAQTAREPGLYLVESPGSPGEAYAVSVAGTDAGYQAFAFTGADDVAAPSGPAPPPGVAPDAGAQLVRQALTWLGLPAGGVSAAVTWLSSGDPDGPVALSTTIRTDAGIDVVAFGSSDFVATDSGRRPFTWLDGLSPSSTQGRDVAWRVTRTAREPDPSARERPGDWGPSVTGQVAVLTSDGVAAVRLVDAGGNEVARQTVRDGAALFIDVSWATTAEFLDGAGKVLDTQVIGVAPGEGAGPPLNQPWWYRLGEGGS